MIFRKISNLGAAVICAASLIGCSLAPKRENFQPLTDNDRLAIHVGASKNIRADVDGAEAIGKGMGKGALGGAAYGFVMGIQCGPLMFFCSPLMAAAGLVGGGVVGGVMGAFEALPEEQARQMNQILEIHVLQGDLTGQLQAAFTQSAAERWSVVAENPTVEIRLGVTRFYFSQHAKNELQLHLSASFSTVFPGETKAREFMSCQHSVEWPVEYWIQDQGVNLQREVETAMREVADAMVWWLRYPGPVRGCV